MASKKTLIDDRDEVDVVIDDWARERPELDTSGLAVFGRISRLHARQRAILNEIYEEYDLTLASFDVLANLRRSGEPHRKTAGELAASSMLTTGGITFRLDKMEEQGLIERVRTPEDRRVVYAQLTERGKTVIDAVIDRHLRVERELLGSLSTAEVTQLATLLREATRSIAAYEAAAGDTAQTPS